MLQGQRCVEREALEKQVYSDVSYDVFKEVVVEEGHHLCRVWEL